MNNTIQKTQITGTYSDPVIEKMVEDRHAVLLEQFKLLGKKHAQLGKPASVEEFYMLSNVIHGEYNNLASICHQTCNATLHQKQGSNEVSDRNTKNLELDSKIDITQTEVAIKRQQVSANKPSKIPMFTLGFGLLLALAIFFGESYFNGNSMQMLGGGFLFCLILGVGIASSMAVIARYVPDIIREKVPQQFQKAAWIGLVFFIIGVFTALSYFRVAFVEKTSGTHDISHIPFILFNLLFFVAFCLIIQLMVKPAFKEFQRSRQSMKAHQEIEKLETNILIWKKEIKTNDEKVRESLQARLAIMAYAKSIQEKVNNLYMINISTYLQTNIENRNDNISFPNWTAKPLNSFDQDVNI